MNSRLNVLCLKCSIFVWNYDEDVNIPQSNYWRPLLRWRNTFLHATSAGLSLTAAFFCADFLRFIVLNAIWSHFIGVYTKYYTSLTRWTRPNWREMARKKSVFWRECRRVGRSLIILNRSIKETENLLLFFYFFFSATRENTAFGVYSVK